LFRPTDYPVGSHGAGKRASVDEQILTGDVPGVRAAHKSTDRAELGRRPQASFRNRRNTKRKLLIERPPGFLRDDRENVSRSVGVESTR
jgi:hypothetical protein